MKQINCTASVAIATSLNFSYAKAGQRIATVKSAPFAVARRNWKPWSPFCKERGPILQARPIRSPSVAVLYTDVTSGDRARQLFENIMRQRLERFNLAPNYILSCIEEENSVAKSLQHLLRTKPTAILIASTTAPAGPEDVIGRAHGARRLPSRTVPGSRGARKSAHCSTIRTMSRFFPLRVVSGPPSRMW